MLPILHNCKEMRIKKAIILSDLLLLPGDFQESKQPLIIFKKPLFLFFLSLSFKLFTNLLISISQHEDQFYFNKSLFLYVLQVPMAFN